MKLEIDNLDGAGARDYTDSLEPAQKLRVLRRKNRPSELHFSLLADAPDFVVPCGGARVLLTRRDDTSVFTGYLAKSPDYEYLGWQQRGPAYRYNIVARSDESLLDQKALPKRHPFVARSAGDALRQLTEDLLPGFFDTSAVEDVDGLTWYSCRQDQTWSEHAAEICLRARAVYRAIDGTIFLSPIGAITHVFAESDPAFSSAALRCSSGGHELNTVTIVGGSEPQAHVTDYFVGDGSTSKFYLSQQPFAQSSRTLLDEEYQGSGLDCTRWSLTDPSSAVNVSRGKLSIAGGTGVDGQTRIDFVEQVELGGALLLQHGNVAFTGASDGVIGGLYSGAVSIGDCLAGFRVSQSAGGSRIQALVSGLATGSAVTVNETHLYALSTRIFSSEVYRSEQRFHSSVYAAGHGRGGAAIPADVRFVLELHDIDPNTPASQIAPSTVLYDGVMAAGPQTCTYALLNASRMYADIAFTRLTRTVNAEVRTACPGDPFRTRLAGSLANGAECHITSEPALQFFPEYVPAKDESIVVRYRGHGVPVVQVADAADILSRRRAGDDGVRGAVRVVKSPPVRTAADCHNAALAILDDSVHPGWSGQYATWSDFLPSPDIFPGDAIHVNAPSRAAIFDAIVQEVEIEIRDVAGEHSIYVISFADEAACSNAFSFESSSAVLAAANAAIAVTDVLADLTAAQVTAVSSTAIDIDLGCWPAAGGGIEVRSSDAAWGQENDRNLIARVNTRLFSVPRLGRSQTCFLRQYDSVGRYSRYSTALHVDCPLS